MAWILSQSRKLQYKLFSDIYVLIRFLSKMLNHTKKKKAGTAPLKPESLVTVAMIYGANSDGTIFSLKTTIGNRPPLSRLETQTPDDWCRCARRTFPTPNLNCRWCQSGRGNGRRTLSFTQSQRINYPFIFKLGGVNVSASGFHLLT